MNYVRRQQYRRLSRAGKAALALAFVGLLGLVVASGRAPALGGLLLLTAVGFGLYARHWFSLAARSSVGARSEDEVQRALAHPQAEGWRLRHSLPWQGRGDIDSVAIAPNGLAVAIETKTRSYDVRHLTRVHEQAVWLPADGEDRAATACWRSCVWSEYVGCSSRGRCPRRFNRPPDAGGAKRRERGPTAATISGR